MSAATECDLRGGAAGGANTLMVARRWQFPILGDWAAAAMTHGGIQPTSFHNKITNRQPAEQVRR